jgi:hypothetical protein
MAHLDIEDIAEILHILYIQKKEEHYKPILLSNI